MVKSIDEFTDEFADEFTDEFCDDFSLSKSSVPMHLKLSDLRNIFNLVLVNNNNSNGGCTFGQYRAVVLRIAIEITYPLNVKNSGAIKAGEAARALSILLNELEKQASNSGNKFVLKRYMATFFIGCYCIYCAYGIFSRAIFNIW